MLNKTPRFVFGAAILLAATACDSNVVEPVVPETSATSPTSSIVIQSGSTITMYAHEDLQLRASDKISRSRLVKWSSTDQSIARVSSNGLVSAIGAGFATVSASGSGSTDRTIVRVVDAASVQVTASKTTLQLGEKLQLTALVVASDGSTSTPSRVTWAVAAGTAVNLSTAGQVTAVASGPATISATVGSMNGALALAVSGPASDPGVPLVTSFRLTPKPATVQAGSTQQFATTAAWADAVAYPYTVTYQATGGVIDLNGLFRAGQTVGSFAVVATCSCGRVDTAVVSVSASSAPSVLTALRLTPKPLSIIAGNVQQFAVQGDWSDALARAIPVTYTSRRGTIDASGLYTASASTGADTVIAAHVGGTLRDTSVITVSAGGGGGGPAFVQPAAPATYNPSYPTITGVSRRVNAGGDLQATLNAAQPGDEIVLASNAQFTGNFTLPAKSASNAWIVVRAATVPTSAGSRTSPSLNAGSATVISPNSAAAIQTANGAKRWRLVGFNVTQATGLSINYGLVVLGVGDETSRSMQPSNIVLDRMYIHGTTTDNLKRCVAFNGDSLAVIDSWLGECHGKGFDSQGVAGWNGAGPFLIQNNRIEAAGQAVMFGGSDPVIQNLSPSDIVIRRNYMFKPLSWGNGLWTVKATFELKHAKRVLFEGNVLENHWADAQVGYAILMQVVSEPGTAYTWTTIQDITIQNNIIKNSTSGINMHARVSYVAAPAPTNPQSRVLIFNNLFTDVGRDPISGATGTMLQLLADLHDVTILNNTMVFNGEVYKGLSLDGGGQVGLTMVNNVFPKTTYGIIGNVVGVGIPAITTYAPGANVQENIFPSQPGNVYPQPNIFPADPASIAFFSPSSGDYSLSPTYLYFSRSQGRIGLNNVTLSAAVAGVAQ